MKLNTCSEVADQIEPKIAPSFIRQLQNINNTELNNTPPDTEKFKPTVKSLKNCKIANDVPFTYVKHVMNDKELDG